MAEGEGLTMKLKPGSYEPVIRSGFEEEREGEAVGRGCGPATHLDVRKEGVMWEIGVGEASDEGVVHEGVRVVESEEEAAGVGESVGDGDGALEEELSGDKRVGFEADLADDGVDLLYAFEGLAVLQKRDA